MASEPYWWQRARELDKQGLSARAIGRIVGKHRTTVLNAINAEYRERHRGQKRARKPSGTYNPERASIVFAARQEASETGEHIDLILKRWGEPMRRERMEARQ